MERQDETIKCLLTKQETSSTSKFPHVKLEELQANAKITDYKTWLTSVNTWLSSCNRKKQSVFDKSIEAANETFTQYQAHGNLGRTEKRVMIKDDTSKDEAKMKQCWKHLQQTTYYNQSHKKSDMTSYKSTKETQGSGIFSSKVLMLPSTEEQIDKTLFELEEPGKCANKLTNEMRDWKRKIRHS
eukprot:Selendium_serpulae@DN1666_c0_g1_i2.p1